MTVAAIVLAASPQSAVADADGVPAARRIADSAWAGGATPIVVVSFDPDGAVAAALAGAPVTLAEPAPAENGPAGQVVRGVDVALAEIAETRAVLLWPARMAWVGPETVTSMIETHGTAGEDVLVPTFDGETGWPVLVPASALDRLRAIAADQMPPAIAAALVAGGPSRELALGDPGVIHDVSTARANLPPYVGPTEPVAGHVHEWGAEAAMAPEDGPLEGPALAPFPPAGADEPVDA